MSENLWSYIKPELLVVAIGLYFVGVALKKCKCIKDRYIPLINGIVSLVLCSIYILATSTMEGWQDIMMAIFVFLSQGILAAGLSTYVNQLIKQMTKKEE